MVGWLGCLFYLNLGNVGNGFCNGFNGWVAAAKMALYGFGLQTLTLNLTVSDTVGGD